MNTTAFGTLAAALALSLAYPASVLVTYVSDPAGSVTATKF